jgi:hypothetical protein
MIAGTDLYATYYSNNDINGDEIESDIDYFVITKTMPVFLCFSFCFFQGTSKKYSESSLPIPDFCICDNTAISLSSNIASLSSSGHRLTDFKLKIHL